ncbi:MAG TPA: hypothetical protein VF092_05085 [Longimicrobium sp.]
MSDPLMEIPEPARSELFALSTTIMPPARQLLENNHAIFPFGIELRADGSSGVLMTGLTEEEEQDPAASRELLRELVRRKAAEGTVRAAAIAFDTRTLQAEADVALDAVCVSLEHVDGHALDVFVPFKKGWFGYSYRNIFMLGASCRIFAPAAAAENGR